LASSPRHANAKISRMLAEVLPPGTRYKIEWPLISATLLALCSLPNPEPGIAKQAGLGLLALNALLSKIGSSRHRVGRI
jgi:hypothetical protein